MDSKNRTELEEKLHYLRLLFEFHSGRWGKSGMTDQETEAHINDILDTMAALEQKLKEDEQE